MGAVGPALVLCMSCVVGFTVPARLELPGDPMRLVGA